MQDPKKIVGNALLSSIGDLSDSYDTLAVLSEDERKIYIKNLIKINDEISRDIASERTSAAIGILLKYQYLVRYKYRIDEPDCFLESSFEHLCRRKSDEDFKLETFKKFKWNTPSESDFISFIMSVISCCDFYERVGFVTRSSYPASLPSSNVSYEEWLDHNFISEEHDCRKHSEELEEAKKKLFFRKSTINQVDAKWTEIHHKHKAFRDEMKNTFPTLHSSKKWLEDLKLSELEKGIELREITMAYEALEQGVQKKHLLAENALEAIDSFQKITRGM